MSQPTFDSILNGGGGPSYFSFGKTPTVGTFIEGTVVDKSFRHKRKFQTKAQHDANVPPQYEYFVGKAKTESQLVAEEYQKLNPGAKPVWELFLDLQTALRDPAKESDDGLRRFTFPWRAQDELAKQVKAQGLQGGLPIGAFVRVTLTGLVPVEGLSEPRREYSVELWGPGEQPSPSPVVQQPVYQAPVQQFPATVAAGPGYAAPQYQVQGNVASTQGQVGGQGGAPVAQFPVPAASPAAGQLTPEIIQIMVSNGMTLTPEVRARAIELGIQVPA